MDKETLSNYGWIVVCVLVLAVLLALASPFGNFIAAGIKSTTQGLFDTNQKALNTTGLVSIESQDFNGTLYRNATIPKGGTYKRGNYTFPVGEKFPAPQTGDTYEEGDYIYKYNSYYGDYGWSSDKEQNGWGVRVEDISKTTYGEIIFEIAGKPVNNLYNTFSGCTSLKTAPVIPNSVTTMSGTFSGCSSLTTAPTIPNSVTNMYRTFSGCESLTTAPTIPNSVTYMSNTFYSCTSLKTAPVIPDSVENMTSTFEYCRSLTTAPVIPDSVNGMSYTFASCYNLTTAPTIPDSVTHMNGTFRSCTSLTTAPAIPDSVENMSYTFYGCTSLTGEIKINANLVPMNWSYENCFSGTTQPITLTGYCGSLKQLAATAKNGNVSVK